MIGQVVSSLSEYYLQAAGQTGTRKSRAAPVTRHFTPARQLAMPVRFKTGLFVRPNSVPLLRAKAQQFASVQASAAC